MPNDHASTLLSTEQRARPIVLCSLYASSVLITLALAWALPHMSFGVWTTCAAPALALQGSNFHYLRTHTLTTVGMIPVSLFALVTPCLACLLGTDLAPFARLLLGGATLLLVAILCLFVVWFWRLRQAYSSHPQVSPTAALIVLGGAIKRGRPCQTLARRLDVASRYWHQEPGRLLVLTGGPTPDGTTTEAHEMARYLQQRGVDASSLLLEPHARNTHENVALSCALLDDLGHEGQRCVVSSDYHLWRAVRDARAMGIELTPLAAPTPSSTILQQWCREVLTILSLR